MWSLMRGKWTEIRTGIHLFFPEAEKQEAHCIHQDSIGIKCSYTACKHFCCAELSSRDRLYFIVTHKSLYQKPIPFQQAKGIHLSPKRHYYLCITTTERIALEVQAKTCLYCGKFHDFSLLNKVFFQEFNHVGKTMAMKQHIYQLRIPVHNLTVLTKIICVPDLSCPGFIQTGDFIRVTLDYQLTC